ncbi:endonuclease III domain-containing protein [Chloroflexota bacterium]
MVNEQIWFKLYHRLTEQYGSQHWWPAGSPFEVMVGAILTQSTAWQNVEKAIRNLKTGGVLSPQALAGLPTAEIARFIHPSGYYNAKTQKIKALVQWLQESFAGDLDRVFAQDIATLRRQLLGIYGVGPETADAIILYAANKPVFVIDAYTRRILSRLGLAADGLSYTGLQDLFMKSLPHEARLFNEYHALLVQHAKKVCRSRPLCRRCCLGDLCQSSSHDICNSGSRSGKLSAREKKR